ncbi:hypothetical protein V1264_020540 [Littorina saxatilis]
MNLCLILTVLLLLVIAVSQHDAVNTYSPSDADNLDVILFNDGSFKINVRGQTWLTSANMFFNSNGRTYAQWRDLILSNIDKINGYDTTGTYKQTTYTFEAGPSKVNAAVRVYDAHPIVYFTQTFENGANRTKAASPINKTISGFPSFQVKGVTTAQGPLGYLAYCGYHTGDKSKAFGIFSPTELNITDGIEFGPITLFDGSGDTLVISSASKFMSVNNWFNKDGDKSTLSYGIMGGVDNVPAGFSVDFIVYYSSQGINQAYEGWGEHLRGLYGRSDEFIRNDLTLNYLGYETDNGSYYYYVVESGKTYQDTILDVLDYAKQLLIPYRYIQYDSWWYFKGFGGGVKSWEARPDIFPDGFQYVHNKTGLPSLGHNRWWSNDTVYAKQNGGQYNFIVESTTGKAVPNDQKFWDDLLENATSWGLVTYEQDWLNVEFDKVDALHSDVSLGDTWLTQMGKAAAKNGITIEYCMSPSRHIMHALQTNAVTQTHASNDYIPGKDQWEIGVSSIFAYAMGIVPIKDAMWSSTIQPGNRYNKTEPNTELQLAVSVLSTGAVAIGDRIGYSNATLIMRCCNAEGLILKPSKPATAVDDQIYQTALGGHYSNGVEGHVWTTYIEVGGLKFGIIFVPDIYGVYSITPTKAGFRNIMTGKQMMVFEARDMRNMSAFSDQAPLRISGCIKSKPCTYHVTPVLTQNPSILMLGELTKVVPVSPQRVTKIDVTGNDVKVYLKGVPSEGVYFTFSIDSNIVTISCTFGNSRTAVLDVTAKTCQ